MTIIIVVIEKGAATEVVDSFVNRFVFFYADVKTDWVCFWLTQEEKWLLAADSYTHLVAA